MTKNATPYDRLTPDVILDAVESTGLLADGRMLALNSYENRVYQIGIEDSTPVIAKFYRPGRWSYAQIIEEHAFTIELAEREIPVVPPLVIDGQSLHEFAGYRFSLAPRRGGRAPELDNPEVLEWMGRFLARIHAVSAIAPFRHRPTLDIASFGEQPRDWLLTHDFIPGDLREAWLSVINQALDGVRECFALAGAVKHLRLHGDCHAGNVLYTDDGPHFVDFDDCRMGPAIQDLWMLLSGTREEMTRQLRDVLEGYAEFADFDRRELHLLEALRTLRLIHYSAWLAQRWDDPAFPRAFPWFNSQRYWQDRILELREQVAAMQEGVLPLCAPPAPRFSLVIPAYNEAAWLPALLDTVDAARLRYRGGADAIEVIVGDNASTDATAALALARGCKVAHIEKRAIAAARNGGAAIATGEIVCFIDADCRIHSETFNAIDDTMSSGRVVVGATGVHPDRWSLGLFVTWLIAVPIMLVTGTDAGVIFCRRADFEAIGGYDESMLYAEDIQVLYDLKRLGRTRGQRFARAKGAIAITSTRKYDKHGDWHYLTVMPRVGFWLLFDKTRMEKYTRAYWYEDR